MEEEALQVSLPDIPHLSARLHVNEPPEETAEAEAESNETTEPYETSEVNFLNDIEGFAEKDTLEYIIGAILHRLGCTACNEKLLTDAPLSRSFITEMTFSSCNLLQPNDSTLKAFASRLKPIISFFENSFHIKNIVTSAARLYKFNAESLSACSQNHADQLIVYFARMLLRVFCKDRNHGLKGSRARSRKLFKLNL